MPIARTKHDRRGFTLIEALVFLFIFSIITVTFYHVYTVGLKYIIDSKNRLGAISIADEKMEIIRNLDYNNIGTVNGEISGSIPDTQSVAENAGIYQVTTVVEYVDDPFDGVYPADTAPEDYKKVTITVSWNAGQESISEASRFVPAGLEVASPGDGVLEINVFSDQPGGTGIPDSNVRVVNSSTGLNTTVQTDSTGSVTLMGDKIKNSIQGYQVVLSKSGYEAVSTMPPYPTTAYNPVDVNASVVVGSMNVINIVQDELATLKVNTVDYLGNPIPNIGFHITGGRKLGTQAVSPFSPVYNLDTDSSTDSSGGKNFGSVSPGQYAFSLLSSVTGYTLIDTNPVSPVSLLSNQNLTLNAELADKNATSLLVKIVSSADGVTPVAGAQVELSNSSGYDVMQTASATGTAFFPASSDAFLPGTYSLKVTASGFSENDSQVTINANQLETTTITLTAS